MTLKYMQGFETMRDDTDFRAQGWALSPTKQQVAFVPSVTALAGTSMKVIAPYATASTTPGTAGAQDPGFLNTGTTVNQAWLAGGFSLGFGATFNSGVSANYAVGTTANSNQACFDGTRYWAIRVVGTTYNIAYSTDLINWTITAAQPATQLWSQSTISYVGGGMIVVLSNNTVTPTIIAYYTTNQGASWSTQTIYTGTNAQNGSSGMAIATGNATYPHAIIATNATSTAVAGGGVFVGTIGGTMTQVTTIAVANYTAMCRPRAIGSLLVMPMSVGYTIYTATAANASLNTTGAWSTATLSALTFNMSDITYHPTSNLWVIAANNGIQTIPNTGSPGTPVALTGTVTATQRYSTAGMQNVWLIGSTLYAAGLSGHIISSTDGGITWVESGGHIIPVGTSGTDWRSSIYDGSKYVFFSDATTGVIATSPDFLSFTAQYVQDGTEQTGTPANGFYDTGIFTGTAPDPTTGLWTAGSPMVNLQVTNVTSNTRSVYLVVASATQWGLTNVVPATTLYNYWEIVARSVSGTPNSFTYSLYLNGALLNSSPTARALASSTTDTTTLLLIGFGRGGRLIGFDDIYFTLDDGVANTLQGPLGTINIAARRPTTDVQAQWTAVGTAGSNAQSVRQTALSQPTGNSVSSFTNGNKDIYSSTDIIPPTYAVKAIQSEAFFSRASTTTPSVSLGKVSGSVEVDSPTKSVASNSATYVSQMFERDPNGSVAWTPTSAQNSQWVINKVS
jgi:hypothetical protein